MISRHQFESVSKLVDSGVTNYVTIRQQAGLTSDELDEIIKNLDYYKKKFAEEDRLKKEEELRQSKKKPWWRR